MYEAEFLQKAFCEVKLCVGWVPQRWFVKSGIENRYLKILQFLACVFHFDDKEQIKQLEMNLYTTMEKIIFQELHIRFLRRLFRWENGPLYLTLQNGTHD